ncbi:calcineurin-like phosphoesterase [Naviculisporaceae sp. PSN 640]
MTILQTLHLRRSSQWDPPTILDHLLTSPLKWLVSIIYSYLLFLRGKPFRPPPSSSHTHSQSNSPTPNGNDTNGDNEKTPIRVVCLSDTHDQTLSPTDIPNGDLLIHAGDLTNDGSREAIQKQIDWLSSLPHQHKVFICGNHDGWFDPNSRAVLESRRRQQARDRERDHQDEDDRGLVNGMRDDEEGTGLDFKGVVYLENSAVTLEFKGGRKLNLWGSGAVPECGDESFAFQYERHLHPWKGAIPEETDVLITHTPPAFHRDLSLGCTGLLAEIWRVKPKLHVFGHIHWGAGTEPFYFDECQRSYESLMSRPSPLASSSTSWLTWFLTLGPLGPLLCEFFPPFMLLNKYARAAWKDALSMIWYGVNSILWKWIMEGPGSNNGGLFVNAAVMYGNTGRLRRSRRGKKVAVVVEL